MNEYYVYQLRVEGDDFPFYIGKGKGDRAWCHLTPKEITKGRNLHKVNKINKAAREGNKVLVEMIHHDLSEEESLIAEVFYIAKFGRSDLGLGPLTNLTNGGEGLSGFKHSSETIKKLAEAVSGPKNFWYGTEGSRKGMKAPESTRAKMRASQLGEKNGFFNMKHTEEAKAAMSIAKLGKPQVSDGFAGKAHSDESKLQIGDSCAKMWKITKPDGTVEIVKNLRKYCRDNNLTAPRMIDVANGGSSHHKGHDCERYTAE